jgi:hypothetical protein
MDKLEIKQGSFIQQTQYFTPMEIDMSVVPGLNINVCPIPGKTDVGQVDLVLRLSDGTSEKVRFPNVPVRRTYLFPLV